jgi:hypothetical protein
VTLGTTTPSRKRSFRLTQEASDRLVETARLWDCRPSDVIRHGLDLATDPDALAVAVAVALLDPQGMP